MKRTIKTRPASYVLLGAAIIVLLLLTSGCGKKGDPEPPSLVVPAKITSLRVVAKPGHTYLTWSLPHKNTDGTRPADLKAFRVYKKTVPVGADSCKFCDEGFKPYLVLTLKNPAHGFVRGDSFYLPLSWPEKGRINVFFVVSLNSRDWESPASDKIAVNWLPELKPPAQLQCQVSASVVELHWQSDIDRIPQGFSLYYNVYRRKSTNLASPLKLITPEPVAESSYIDVGLTDWRAYEYSVTQLLASTKVSRESRYSTPVKVVPGDYTPPSPVQNFTAFCYLGGVQLVWDPVHDADLAGYRVYRLDTVNGIKSQFDVAPSLHEYFDRDVVKGRKYIYHVVSYDTSERENESPESAAVAVTCSD